MALKAIESGWWVSVLDGFGCHLWVVIEFLVCFLQAEVFFLGQLRHPNVVNLIGYCVEDEQRVLVYEYLEGGNLENLLFQGNSRGSSVFYLVLFVMDLMMVFLCLDCYVSNLTWLQRMKIALGSAKGLAFLHKAERPIVFRDFKASNILLDSVVFLSLFLTKDGNGPSSSLVDIVLFEFSLLGFPLRF